MQVTTPRTHVYTLFERVCSYWRSSVHPYGQNGCQRAGCQPAQAAMLDTERLERLSGTIYTQTVVE